MLFKRVLFSTLIMLFMFAAQGLSSDQQIQNRQEETQLSLITATPEEGFQLAIALARKGVIETQPDKEVLRELRTAYARDPKSLIASSQVIAIYFQTIAEANEYWIDR